MSEAKEPCEVEQIERNNTTKMNKVEDTPLEKRRKEHDENLKVERHKKRVAMAKKCMQALRLKRDVQGTIKINCDNSLVGNGRNRI